MAKRSNRQKGIQFAKFADAPEEVEYITSSGLKVLLTGMPPMLGTQIEASIPDPEVPQYEVETATGAVERYDHDETTLTTDEEKAAWEKYKVALNKAETARTEKLLQAILLESVEVVDFEEKFKKWKNHQRILSLPIPEDEEEAITRFKELHVYRSTQDVEIILRTVMSLTGVSGEAVEETKASFPDTMEPEPQDGTGNSSVTTEGGEG